MITAVIMIFFAFNLVRCRVGRAFIAIRDNDNAAEMTGINVFYYKTLAFAIGAGYAGVAGGTLGLLSPVRGGRPVYPVLLGLVHGHAHRRRIGQHSGGHPGRLLYPVAPGIHHLSRPPSWWNICPRPWGPKSGFAGMNILLGGIIVLFLIYDTPGTQPPVEHHQNVVPHMAVFHMFNGSTNPERGKNSLAKGYWVSSPNQRTLD